MICNLHFKHSSRSENGFTLVEVMVSLAIMVLIATVAFAGLRIGLNSWDRGSRRVEELGQKAVVERLLDRQLALASTAKLTSDAKAPLFSGDKSQIEFISNYSLTDGTGDPRKIDYAVKDGQFLYGETPLYAYSPGAKQQAPAQPLGRFGNVRFRYLAVDDKSQFVWLDEWKTNSSLPIAVETRINDDSIFTMLVNQ